VNLMRTLQKLPSEQIVAMGLHETSLGNLELATYICDYLAARKKQKFRNQLIRGMATMGFEPIEFLSKAREIAQTFQKTTTGNNHVYVILLDGYSKQRYGVYVGQTSRRVEARFEQHITGHKYAARCHRKMTILLPSLFEHLNPLSTKEALLLEEQIAKAFSINEIRTEGGH
jgi:hypothetical protein